MFQFFIYFIIILLVIKLNSQHAAYFSNLYLTFQSVNLIDDSQQNCSRIKVQYSEINFLIEIVFLFSEAIFLNFQNVLYNGDLKRKINFRCSVFNQHYKNRIDFYT